MQHVWVVYERNYDDSQIVGVFTDFEKARVFCGAQPADKYETYTNNLMDGCLSRTYSDSFIRYYVIYEYPLQE